MKNITILYCIIFFFAIKEASPQNVDLLGSLNPYPNLNYSDIWGYAAGGREYALMGVTGGTSIIDVTNPAVPVEVSFIPGPLAPPYEWRDIKTHLTYAYIVTEGTGAGSGMGKASAIMFAKEGAKVVAADMNEEAGRETVKLIKDNGGEAVFAKVDVSNEDDVKKMIKTAVDNFGKLSIVFNIAGCPQETKPFETIQNDEWDRIMNVNVKSIFFSTKHALEELKKEKGVVLNVASVGGERPRPGSLAYATSKGGVINMSRALAAELAKYQVRVNCINPGPTDTPMMFKFIPEFNEDIKNTIGSGTALGKWVMPEDIASAGVFLASDEASRITGADLPVDSGLRVGRSEV